ncbi:MAG TPA: L-threonylcarbamoyladenylate synthase [Casimicrobiaceae bacterium]|nr:L-threonylcarbamoyladenylate synthase [Casimicrobiaceae bacterium]
MTQFIVVHPTHPQPRLIRGVAALLRNGAVAAYPTDSSYALGCRLDDAKAVKRIRAIRGLDDRHHMTLVCRDLADVGHFARLDNWQFRLVRQGTPGPFTFILPATREVPRRLQHPRRSTIGVRVPKHPVVLALLKELGAPIVSSTLMLTGDASPIGDPETLRGRAAEIDVVIDGGPVAATPTTVIDLARAPGTLVRLGGGDPARLGLAVD